MTPRRRFTYRRDSYADEPAHGLVLRRAHAARMGTVARAWKFLRTSAEEVRLGNGLEDLAWSCGVDPAEMAHATFRELGGRRVSMLGHDLPFEGVVRQFRRWCPDCLAEHPYHRAAWDVAAVSHCVTHRRPLETKCPGCREPVGWDRLDLLRCRCRAKLTTPFEATVEAPALAFDVWLSGRLRHEPQGEPETLAGMALDRALALVERLGAHALRPHARFHDTWRELGAAAVFGEGFSVADAGVPGFHAFLDRLLVENREGPGTHKAGGGWGLTRAYGPFATWLIRNASQAAYRAVTKAAAEHAVANVVVKSGAKVFGRRMRAAQLGVGIADVGERAGVGHTRMRRIARSLGHLPATLQQGRPARLERRLADELSSRLAAGVDLKGAARLLGVGHALARRLVEAGLLAAFVSGGRDGLCAYVIERDAIADLLRRLEPSDPKIAPEDAAALPVVAPRNYVAVTEAIRWALDGKLAILGVDTSATGLCRLLVRGADLARLRRPGTIGGLSLNEVASRLGTHWQVVRQLVELGRLPAREHAGARWVDDADLAAFEARYVKGSDAAAMLGTGRRWAESVLARYGVAPAIGRDECRLTFFPRDRVLAAARSATASKKPDATKKPDGEDGTALGNASVR